MFKIEKIVLVLIFFLLIFSPPIPIFYNGTVLACLISMILLLFKRKNKSIFLKINDKYTKLIFLFLFLIIVVGIAIPTFHGTYDYSIIKTFVNQGISIFSLLVVLSYTFSVTTNLEEIHKLIFYTFALQSISILCAMASPAYHEFVIKVSGFSERMLSFRGGIRTYSLAGSKYFGLGATYGLIYILFLDSLFRYKWFNLKWFFIFILLVIGTFFTARTGFVGLALGLLMALFVYTKKMINPVFISKIGLLFFGLFTTVYMLLSEEVQLIINNRIIPYAFDLFLQENGKIESSSTNGLINMWDIPMDSVRLLFGDGWYTSENGGYYMHTDAGYLRNILFGGVGYFLLLFLYQVYLVNFLFRIKGYKILFLTLLSYTLILQLKGETIGFLIIFQIVLLLYIFSIKNTLSNSY
ncbi:hypothetical protein [Tenacibaculum piscium]|uniref:hypothetical protein n=1 Tax=Tenacibaculum piscium TaxID=1458515 RepID=UPI001F45AF6A|nr:hypothetical protein [Tenacibaculum piscium]